MNSTVFQSSFDPSSEQPILSVENLCADLEEDQKTLVSKIYLDGGTLSADIVTPKIFTSEEISAIVKSYISSLGTLVYWSGNS